MTLPYLGPSSHRILINAKVFLKLSNLLILDGLSFLRNLVLLTFTISIFVLCYLPNVKLQNFPLNPRIVKNVAYQSRFL